MRSRPIALLLLLAACAPSKIDRPASSRGRFHRFRVKATAAPNSIRHDLGLSEIARLPGGLSNSLHTQGVTAIRHGMATKTKFSSSTGDEAVSVWFDDVILEVSITSVTVYMPREYPVGSCEYLNVLEHERGHARAAREQAVYLASRLERTLGESAVLATPSDPVIADDYASAVAALKASIARIVDPVYAQYEKDAQAAQAALDAPALYAAVYRRCNGWK